jgi:FKBP-type peptidyl-prolyl cis-trans isomerase
MSVRLIAQTVLAAAALAVVGPPTGARAADEVKLSTEDQKTSYVMGYSLARNLDSYALKPEELDTLIAGLREGLAGKDSRVPLEEYAQKIGGLKQARAAEVAAKAAEGAKAEKEASAAFLDKEASASGATKASSGLVKRIVKEGTGPSPAATDTVKVHYHGTLRDGSVFDSSVERGEPAEFPLNRVIRCWTEAVQTMKVGEKAHITCPSDIAYGDKGAPPKIKGGAALAFDVELIEIVKPVAGGGMTPGQ